MSAFDKLGLAMIPSGYKGEGVDRSVTPNEPATGKVYSVLPAQTTSANLVTNGTFDADSDWNTGTGWTIANGVASCDGTQTSTSTLQTSLGISGITSKSITLSFEVNNYSSGILNVTLEGTGQMDFPNISADGIYSATIVSTDSTPKINFNANTDFVGSIDNVSLVRITDGDFDFSRGSDATRVNSQGLIESVQVLSDELVQNGDFEDVSETEEVTNGGFDTDLSGWVKYSNTLISWQSGGYVVLNNDNGYWCKIQQGNVFEVGKVYKVVMTAKSNLANVNLHGSLFSEESFSEVDTFQTFTQYYKSTSTTFAVGFANVAPYGEVTITIDNISVKEVGQNWTFGDGWSITDDGGNLKATKSGTDLSYLTHNIVSSVSGKKYRTSFNVTGFTAGNFRVDNVGDGVTQNPQADFTYTIDHTATVSGDFRILGWNGFNGTIDNISVVEVTDDTDIPRLDYTNQACPSLLLEPQRTNLIENSNDFSPSNWTPINSGSVTYGFTDLNGTETASRLSKSGNTVGRIYKSISYSGDNTFSIYAKADTYNWIRLYFDGVNANAYFGLQNGVVGTTTNVTNASIVPMNNGWYRITVSVNGSGTTVRIYPAEGDNNLGLTGSIFIQYAQLEQGSHPTSYIPTNGSTVTRLADVCNNAGDSTIFNDDEGVLYAEIGSLKGDSNSNREISLSDGTLGNSLRIYFGINYENRIIARLELGGSFAWVGSVDVTSKINKVALRYNSSGLDFFVNGVKELTTTTLPNFTNSLSSLQFRRGDGVTGSDFYGKTRSLLYFNEALTDAELEALTSSNIDRVLKNYNRRGELLGATYESTHVKTKLNELF